MLTNRPRKLAIAIAAHAALAAGFALPVVAQQDESMLEEVIITGTRVKDRSASDSAAPIDVISGNDFSNMGDSDMTNLLRSQVPSYNVNTQPISDAATIVRPANLRGLPPDNTLVLVNGKRRHRAAVITFLGGGLSNGSQGPDVSSIPAMALERVEVLRDGAAAQYGSDAIAGVINFVLKEDAEGGTIEAKYGEYYEGDGTALKVSGNVGLPLSPSGFANLSFEFGQADPTSRSVQRSDAAALRAAGNTAVGNPAQIWGSPEVEEDIKIFLNTGIEVNESTEAYAFGSYGQRTTIGGFFFRNPNTRPAVFSNDGGATHLIGDVTPDLSGNCPIVNVGDTAGLSAVEADPNCFVFTELFPGGFTPSFGGDLTDLAGVMGVRGAIESGLTYDVSLGAGRNEVEFFINNTVNASLGPQTPTSFNPGTYIQFEKNINVDLTYPIDMGWASDLNVAGGFEWREETFEAKIGDIASWEDGPLVDQGFSIGSNGFPGFSPEVSGEFDRDNIALYIDLEAELTSNFLLGIAGRWEDFSDFGSTTNGKISGRWDISDSFAVRATASTGFRAPTPGQSNITNVTTQFTNGVLTNQGTIPPTNPIAQTKGGDQLEPEESTGFSLGAVFGVGDLSVTVDYFNIEVTDRITQSQTFTLTDAERTALVEDGITGADSLVEFLFYINDFDTTTEGIDVVATYPLDLLGGSTMINFIWNWTKTEIDSFDPATIDELRIRQLEENLPEYRSGVTLNHTQGAWSGLLRLNYYGEYWEAHLDDITLPIDAGEEWTVDFEVSYDFNESMQFSAGADNIFDEEPDKNPWDTIVGSAFPATSPMGFNGGFWYVRGRYMF